MSVRILMLLHHLNRYIQMWFPDRFKRVPFLKTMISCALTSSTKSNSGELNGYQGLESLFFRVVLHDSRSAWMEFSQCETVEHLKSCDWATALSLSSI